MDRKYEITIQIGGYRKDREEEIKRVCMVEWSFRDDDFMYVPVRGAKQRLLDASALGVLYDGEEIEEFIERLERAVWRANGSLCHVDVQARRLVQNEDDPILFAFEEEERMVG